MARVVNMRDEQATRRIDRATRWGNPYRIGKHGDRQQVIALYREWLWQEIRSGAIALQDLAELHTEETLGCWCYPQDCHGDVLARAAAWAYKEVRK